MGLPVTPGNAVERRTVSEMDEAQLVRRCKLGDERAWSALYTLHAPTVARFARRLLVEPQAVDDVVQQVFVAFFDSLDGFRGESKVSTWLYRITARVAARRTRTLWRWQRRKDAVLTISRDDLVNTNPIEDREQIALLARTLDAMGHKHRAVWVMRELEGLSTQGVAEALDLPEGTVRSRLSKARGQILSAFEKAGYARGGRP